jgi:hypothetical protein
MTDRFEQYRRELPKKLAYQYWERRGRPLGSPEIELGFGGKSNRSVPVGFRTGISDSSDSSGAR